MEYALDGVTFSTTLPAYDQDNPITVTTACVCGPMIGSVSSIMTMPITNCCPDLTGFEPNPIDVGLLILNLCLLFIARQEDLYATVNRI